MHRVSKLALALTLLCLGLIGCEEEEAPTAVEEITVAQAARLIESGEGVAIDANGAQTRAEQGVVPGARLLTSSGTYDVDAELPDDPSLALIFYCANTDCHASDGAAERAREAGRDNVKVMREGIAGWVAAGRETSPPTS